LQINVSVILGLQRDSPPVRGAVLARRFSGYLKGGRSLFFRFSGGDSKDSTRPMEHVQIEPDGGGYLQLRAGLAALRVTVAERG
jgi:hypothetical protein